MHARDEHAATVTSIAVAVVEDQNRFLIGPRPSGSNLEGFWEFPGGKVEVHENIEQAAVRECHEETGLKVRVVGHFLETIHVYDHGTVKLSFLDCVLASAARTPRHPFVWVARDELHRYEFPAGNAPLLQQLFAR